VSFDGVALRPDGAQAATPIFSRFDNRFPGIVFCPDRPLLDACAEFDLTRRRYRKVGIANRGRFA
jgi:hypothetical protein